MKKKTNLESRILDVSETSLVKTKGKIINTIKKILPIAALVSTLYLSPIPMSTSDAYASAITANYTNSEATIKIPDNKRAHKISILKNADGTVKVKADKSNYQTIRFRNEQEFKERVGKFLDHQMGKNRKHINNQVDKAYHKLNLASANNIPRQNNTNRQDSSSTQISRVGNLDTILNANFGVYTFDKTKTPMSYLLVRNANTGSYYCLSLVQETFDLMYGVGEAKKVGLYSSKYAQDLKINNTHAKVEKYVPSKHNNLPKGAIIRLSYFRGENIMSSIGISLGNGKMAHIIGSELYIEKIQENLNQGWHPNEVILPNSSFKESYASIKPYNPPSNLKDKSLEQVTAKIGGRLYKQQTNVAAMQEIVYQYNKDKFEPAEFGSNNNQRDSLKYKGGTLNVPSNWYNR